MSNQNKVIVSWIIVTGCCCSLVSLEQKNKKSGSQYVPASSIVEPFMPSLTYKVDKVYDASAPFGGQGMEILCLYLEHSNPWFLLDLEC